MQYLLLCGRLQAKMRETVRGEGNPKSGFRARFDLGISQRFRGADKRDMIDLADTHGCSRVSRMRLD